MRREDISSELWREYRYKDGEVVRVYGPKSLFISPNGSHRVLADDGLVYWVSGDFRHLVWMPKDGNHPVDF